MFAKAGHVVFSKRRVKLCIWVDIELCCGIQKRVLTFDLFIFFPPIETFIYGFVCFLVAWK